MVTVSWVVQVAIGAAGSESIAFLIVIMSIKGKKAVSLLRDLKRSSWLPPYDERAVREVLEEYNECEKVVQALADEHEEASKEGDEAEDLAAGITVYNQTIERNKRCVLAYHYYRLQKIRELRWSHGRVIPTDGGLDEKLHEHEVQYFHKYNEILDKYMHNYLPTAKEPLDLTDGQKIPEDLLVWIKVLDDGLGEIMTADSGVVRLEKGAQILVQRSDFEMLIRSGKVEQLPTCTFT